jgi:formylglycine-generating enzyme required for sulfatase activity
MGNNPSHFSATGEGKASVRGMDTSKFPVESVSWNDAVAFCKKLSALEGRTYRLPTEAEWEYACRADARSVFGFGDSLSSTQANFDGTIPYGIEKKWECLERTTTVGSYEANAWGLHDMHGNVWEWCSDWFERDYYGKSPSANPRGPEKGLRRVRRGGAWSEPGKDCRSATRALDSPTFRSQSVGFRVVMEPR